MLDAFGFKEQKVELSNKYNKYSYPTFTNAEILSLTHHIKALGERDTIIHDITNVDAIPREFTTRGDIEECYTYLLYILYNPIIKCILFIMMNIYHNKVYTRSHILHKYCIIVSELF
jgi:hypothetical protein